MQNLQTTIDLNNWPIVQVIIYGLLLYFLLQLGKRILSATTEQHSWFAIVQSNWPLVERIFWVVFSLVSVAAFIKPNPILGSILIAALAAAFWRFIRNYITGIIVLSQRDFQVGQSIRFEGYSGKIKALHSTKCEIELTDSAREILLIPYADFSHKLIIKTSPAEHLTIATTYIDFEGSTDQLFNESIISSALVNNPWIAYDDESVIQLVEETESGQRFKVTLRGIDSNHLKRAERMLKKQVTEK